MTEEYLLKWENGPEQTVMRATEPEVQAFIEAQVRANPAKGVAVVYKRYASAVVSDAAPVTWTMGTPPATP